MKPGCAHHHQQRCGCSWLGPVVIAPRKPRSPTAALGSSWRRSTSASTPSAPVSSSRISSPTAWASRRRCGRRCSRRSTPRSPAGRRSAAPASRRTSRTRQRGSPAPKPITSQARPSPSMAASPPPQIATRRTLATPRPRPATRHNPGEELAVTQRTPWLTPLAHARERGRE